MWSPAGDHAAIALAGQLVSQHLVLDRQVASNQAWESDYVTIAADLSALGVRPPCLLNGEQYLPIAYVMGCSSGPASRRIPCRRAGTGTGSSAPASSTTPPSCRADSQPGVELSPDIE